MRVLFVCVHNAGRSVMAEAFARAIGLDAASAGTVPQEAPHPEVVEAMREIGVDIASHRGRMLSDDLIAWADRVVTMGCSVDDEACPAIRLREVEDWGLPDPKGRARDDVRAIRDEIRARVEALRSRG